MVEQCGSLDYCFIFPKYGWILLKVPNTLSTTTREILFSLSNMQNGDYHFGKDFFVYHWRDLYSSGGGGLLVAYRSPGIRYEQ